MTESRHHPSYGRILIAAGTTFPFVLVGGWTLWLACDLNETGFTGFGQSVCEGPAPGIGLSLVLFAPLGTVTAGLVSREYDKTPWPFYISWVAGIALG